MQASCLLQVLTNLIGEARVVINLCFSWKLLHVRWRDDSNNFGRQWLRSRTGAMSTCFLFTFSVLGFSDSCVKSVNSKAIKYYYNMDFITSLVKKEDEIMQSQSTRKISYIFLEKIQPVNRFPANKVHWFVNGSVTANFRSSLDENSNSSPFLYLFNPKHKQTKTRTMIFSESTHKNMINATSAPKVVFSNTSDSRVSNASLRQNWISVLSSSQPVCASQHLFTIRY